MKESRAPERDLAEIRDRIAKTERELDVLRALPKRQIEGRKGPGLHPEMMAKLEVAGRKWVAYPPSLKSCGVRSGGFGRK